MKKTLCVLFAATLSLALIQTSNAGDNKEVTLAQAWAKYEKSKARFDRAMADGPCWKIRQQFEIMELKVIAGSMPKWTYEHLLRSYPRERCGPLK